MGLLDGVLGSVVNAAIGGQGGKNPLGDLLSGLAGSMGGSVAGGAGGAQPGGNLLVSILGLVQQQGGLEGLVGMLRQRGLGEHVDSWVGTGANKAVGAQQLVNALGGAQIAQIAQIAASLGIDQNEASTQLAKLLPEVVNRLTPGGKVDGGSNDLLAQALAAFTGGR
jgi:uncharacterized protein YidB (DUF937 family)